MCFLRFLIAIFGSLAAAVGYCDGGLWLIEQEFVKFGKQRAYEDFKKEQQLSFVKRMGVSSICVENAEDSHYVYMIPVSDFKGMNALMQKRDIDHKNRAQDEQKLILPLLSCINFFIESLLTYLPECSLVPSGKDLLLSHSAVCYTDFGVIPGNGPEFEKRLIKLVEEQKNSSAPISFGTWRMLIGGDTPSYFVAVFADSIKEAKQKTNELQIITKEMKNLLRQEKKGSGLIRKDLSSLDR
jgi:hypothetical protein